MRLQREIAALDEVPGDPYYAENALAVYTALAGDAASALEILDSLGRRLRSRRDPEPSMRYLVAANRSCVLYVTGEIEEARAQWGELAGVVNQIPYVIGRFLVKRHALLTRTMAKGTPIDQCLIADGPSSYEFGPLWDQLGRGFRMPEVEWWR